MADQVTSEKSPDEIEREMFQTREAITEKVAALEDQIVGTAQSVADTISDTVETVKSFVSAAPETVSDTVKQASAAVSEAVKDTFDITGHVRRHPWGALGVSALLGCVTGWLLSRDRASGDMRAMAAASVQPPAPAPTASEPTETKPGILNDILEMVGAKVKELARDTLETATATVKENLQTGVSRLVEDTAHDWTLSCNQRADVPTREQPPVRL